MPTVRETSMRGMLASSTALDHALAPGAAPARRPACRAGFAARPRRSSASETAPIGQIAASGFLPPPSSTGSSPAGQIGRVGDAAARLHRLRHRGRRRSPATRRRSNIAVLEKLDIAGSLVFFDVADAQQKIATLPWVEHATVRKFYPSTLADRDRGARSPTRSGSVTAKCWSWTGTASASSRSTIPASPSCPSSSAAAPTRPRSRFLAELPAQPDIAAQMHDAVLVADRRWDLHLENGVTVQAAGEEARRGACRARQARREKQAPRTRRVGRRPAPARPHHRAAAGGPLARRRDLGEIGTIKSTKTRT